MANLYDNSIYSMLKYNTAYALIFLLTNYVALVLMRRIIKASNRGYHHFPLFFNPAIVVLFEV